MLSKILKLNFLSLFVLSFSILSSEILLAENIQTQALYFFDDALKVDVSGKTTAKTGAFTLNIIDPSTNTPWTDLTAQNFEGTVEMTDMDMGLTPVKVTDVSPGVIKMETKFSMSGSWRLNITIKPTGSEPETKSIEFKVN